MADYQEKVWGTGSQLTPGEVTEISRELNEQENYDLSQDQRISILEDKAAVVFPVERYSDGFSNLHRILPGGNSALISGRIQLEYFTAPDTLSVTKIQKFTGSTPISGTAPTLSRLGVYSVAANGDLTRIARTNNDPGMFAVAFDPNTKTFETPCAFVRGSLYAAATLIVTTGTICSLWGTASIGGGMLDDAPALTKQVSAQSDLPATILNAQAVPQASVYSYNRFII